MFLAKRLDLDVDACRQIQLHQRIHGLRRRLEDVDQALVRSDLELLPRLLSTCGERSTVHLLIEVREAESARQPRASALGRIDDSSSTGRARENRTP